MIEIKPPASIRVTNFPKIFLGGSIEMGLADDWQNKVKDALVDRDVILFNPRRDNWDSSWAQRANNPVFAEQVTWELDALESADIVIFYFDPATKSPITLLELGLSAEKINLIVCCPDGFWRKGNVEIVCNRFDIKMVNTFDELIDSLHHLLNQHK